MLMLSFQDVEFLLKLTVPTDWRICWKRWKYWEWWKWSRKWCWKRWKWCTRLKIKHKNAAIIKYISKWLKKTISYFPLTDEGKAYSTGLSSQFDIINSDITPRTLTFYSLYNNVSTLRWKVYSRQLPLLVHYTLVGWIYGKKKKE